MLTGFWNSDVVEWFRDMSSSNDSFVLFFFFWVYGGSRGA
jgi:hypothetical protein